MNNKETIENKGELQASLEADVEAFLRNGGKITCLSSSDYQRERTQTKKELLRLQKARTHAIHFKRKRGGK